MSKVVFNGIAKTITINSGVTDIDVMIDLYSEWKSWLLLSDNIKYEQAFRTFGGDTTAAGQNAPRYFFLLNGWKVIADNVSVLVSSNLYTEDSTSPFIVQNNGNVQLNNSDIPGVKSLEDLIQDIFDAMYSKAVMDENAGTVTIYESDLTTIKKVFNIVVAQSGKIISRVPQ